MNIVILIFFVLFSSTRASIIEGFVKTFKKGDPVHVYARKLSSNKGLPFRYYSLPFCRPADIESFRPSLGEYFFGDRVESTVFKVNMLEDVTCRRIETDSETECPEPKKSDIANFLKKMKDSYIIQLEIDNLPAADLTVHGECGYYMPYFQSGDNPDYRNANGFLIGCKVANSNEFILNNHFSFNIKYHESAEGEYSIIAFEVYPSSVSHTKSSCQSGKEIPRKIADQYLFLKDELVEIPWSYSVRWEPSKIKWSSRWDNYIHANEEDRNTHWFAIVNSILVVVFLTGCVAFIMLSVLRKDILVINTQDDDEPDETGWKKIHGEVFRPPKLLMLLSMSIGSGVQILGTLFFALIGALIGVLSPANRGGLMSGTIIVTAFMGILAGYHSLKFYKQHEGEKWKTTTLLTAFFFPGAMFFLLSTSNFLFTVATHSTISLPFMTLLMMFLLWLGVYVPLVFIGGLIGTKRSPLEFPCKIRRIPKQVPKQPWYVSPLFSVLLGGILPFGAIFIELYFIFSSLWLNRFYYLFGFLFVVFLILLLTSSEITIVLTYFQLCNEDYRWWWRSFLSSASSGFYLFLYSVLYYVTTLKVPGFLLGMVYFNYMGIVCFAFSLMTGTIGFFASNWFVWRIYSSIRID